MTLGFKEIGHLALQDVATVPVGHCFRSESLGEPLPSGTICGANYFRFAQARLRRRARDQSHCASTNAAFAAQRTASHTIGFVRNVVGRASRYSEGA